MYYSISKWGLLFKRDTLVRNTVNENAGEARWGTRTPKESVLNVLSNVTQHTKCQPLKLYNFPFITQNVHTNLKSKTVNLVLDIRFSENIFMFIMF